MFIRTVHKDAPAVILIFSFAVNVRLFFFANLVAA